MADHGKASAETTPCSCGTPSGPQPIPMFSAADEPCCGPPPGPASSHLERPGYRLWHFVEDFIDTPSGPVPRVKTRMEKPDFWGTVLTRSGPGRADYKVAPGLYCVGNPDGDSAVLVSANYKLSFDALRRELDGVDAWILVVDTRGINVWCSAGKGLFSAEEVGRLVGKTGLAQVVRHRRLILPQLSATGVSAARVKRACGFEVVWGPVRAADIRKFLADGMKADETMRRVTFHLAERLVLVPVEIYLLKKPVLWLLLAIFALSGIGPDVFSFGAAWQRGWVATAFVLTAILAGAVAAPILLPWLPGRSFALKGAITGLAAGLISVAWLWGGPGIGEFAAVLILTTALSSYLAMNFTGSTPYTSPSGVEKEMRRAIPIQAAAVLASALIWVGSAFTS